MKEEVKSNEEFPDPSNSDQQHLFNLEKELMREFIHNNKLEVRNQDLRMEIEELYGDKRELQQLVKELMAKLRNERKVTTNTAYSEIIGDHQKVIENLKKENEALYGDQKIYHIQLGALQHDNEELTALYEKYKGLSQQYKGLYEHSNNEMAVKTDLVSGLNKLIAKLTTKNAVGTKKINELQNELNDLQNDRKMQIRLKDRALDYSYQWESKNDALQKELNELKHEYNKLKHENYELNRGWISKSNQIFNGVVSELEQLYECCICSEPSNILFNPCGHIKWCHKCWTKWVTNEKTKSMNEPNPRPFEPKCSHCTQTIKTFLRINHKGLPKITSKMLSDILQIK